MSAPARFPEAFGVKETGIRRAAVIGAGSMGSGIAAQFANAGVPVDLIDIPGPDTSSRSAPARAGIDRQLKSGGFMHPDAAGLVRPGNIEDDLGRLAEADWIVEAIVEKLDVKRDLYRKVEAARRKGSIVSSNTSTIPRADLVEGMGADFAADFLITHFFNPPRVMRLVEIVSAPDNPLAIVEKARVASETVLGKTVVDCRDTPGFIANRIGCYWLAVGALEAMRLGLTPEEADAVNAAFGIPKTGVFGLLDLIGIDLIPQVWGSLMQSLPAGDVIHAFDLPGNPLVRSMLEKGLFGRKSKAGFYRLAADKSREVMDLATGEYRAAVAVAPKILPGEGRDIAALVASDDRIGRYAWSVLSHVVCYSAENGPEIAADVGSVDVAMALGYAWKDGPFRLADACGVKAVTERLSAEGRNVPPLLASAVEQGGFYAEVGGLPLITDGSGRRAETRRRSGLAEAKATKQPMFGNDAASVWDLGDGVACFEMHTKMNSFAPAVFEVLEEAIERGGHDFGALVLGNDNPRAFSVGADLSFIVGMIRREDWQALDRYIARGQDLFLRLKYSGFPVVAAVQGFALGGGCELMLHADAVVAHAEINAGLPEAKVGLIPAWGGCTELLVRAQQAGSGPKGPAATADAVFQTIFPGAVSSSALDARARGLVRGSDTIVMNPDQLHAAAIAIARETLRSGYQKPEPALVAVAGPSGKLGIMNMVHGARAAGSLSEHDVRVADILAEVLTGGPGGDLMRPMPEADMMALERAALLELVRMAATRARIDHMLATGKPLRN